MEHSANELGLKTGRCPARAVPQTGDGSGRSIQAIEHYREGENVFVVGVTNVGEIHLYQSDFEVSWSGRRASFLTTSRFPGTTLNMIQIPWQMGRHFMIHPE